MADIEIRNVYNFRIQNKSERAAVYFVESQDAGDAQLVLATPRLQVQSLADATTSAIARLPRTQYGGPFGMSIAVTDSVSGERRIARLTFRGP